MRISQIIILFGACLLVAAFRCKPLPLLREHYFYYEKGRYCEMVKIRLTFSKDHSFRSGLTCNGSETEHYNSRHDLLGKWVMTNDSLVEVKLNNGSKRCYKLLADSSIEYENGATFGRPVYKPE